MKINYMTLLTKQFLKNEQKAIVTNHSVEVRTKVF